ncbi:aminotransferase class I/II-fold pyridoxal phosphate-dependent enzyme [Paracoccus onubensis]|uniref:aminotransferase class I/II-fold pyridoxal phosphate-dependent enzyme n=1 Tax=Paracoccus onubensis TaxID=1675788 RepID=UPI00273214F5|nr:aminotransferase class I/II-fold pyridoxal phosphate-dependent enzyme [Paracoccus onubensis]MDP0928703.1 aminotransferase class I/II-fold pyridoxal phosphate-dependent enzyme [Paracoccus onubensis]
MNYESKRAQLIKPSPAISVSIQAKELTRQGIDVIDLSVGEPDFDTPMNIIQAATEAMKEGQTHYTAPDGTPELKQAIADAFRRDQRLDFANNEITAGNGAKQIIFNALMATLEPGDEVIIPAPYWVSYTDMVLLVGGAPKIVECPYNMNFKLTASALEAAITPRTRWLFLNSPSNPTGATYSREELGALGDVIKRHENVMVLADEIYDQIQYGDALPLSFLAANPGLKDRALIVNGVSKAYAMTGWRLGYAAGPAPLIKVMGKIQSQSTSNPSSVSQAAAIEALSGPQDFLAEARAEYAARREIVFTALEAIPQLRAPRPDGAFYAYVDCSALIGRIAPDGNVLENDADVARFLLNTARIAVVPGVAFGMSPYFRMSFATSRKALETACSRLGRAVQDLFATAAGQSERGANAGQT